MTASVNTGALSSASAAASTATAAAQDVMQRDRAASRQNLPSIISVQILGYGDEQLPAGRAPASPASTPASRRRSIGPTACSRWSATVR